MLTGFSPKECLTANYFVRDCLDDLDEAEKRISILEKALETLKVAVNDKQPDPSAVLFISMTLAKSRGMGK